MDKTDLKENTYYLLTSAEGDQSCLVHCRCNPDEEGALVLSFMGYGDGWLHWDDIGDNITIEPAQIKDGKLIVGEDPDDVTDN